MVVAAVPAVSVPSVAIHVPGGLARALYDRQLADWIPSRLVGANSRCAPAGLPRRQQRGHRRYRDRQSRRRRSAQCRHQETLRLNQDNSVNSASKPAARGSIIQIYATGEGQTSPIGVTASVTGTDLKTPVLQVKVSIGGQDAVVQYAGSAGGAVAGLLQVNAVVPQAVSPGAAVPISVSVGGVSSQSGATIAVQ
jgi:hypothetical protein